MLFHFVLFLRLIQESDPFKMLSWFQKHTEKHKGDGNSRQPSAEGQSFQQCSISPGGFSVYGEHTSVDATRFSLEDENHSTSKGAKGRRG